MRNKHLCLHAHLDLPPAETPWLGEVEPDPSASPYRDAYDSIYHTVLGPNAASPLLDEDGRIHDFINNFAYVSFDIGAPLLAWLEREHPRTYAKILEADRLQISARGGHGGALASPWVSLILPLESVEDRRAAIRWGLLDFQNRFQRPAEGFWLPETAADDETLGILAREGLRFVLLAPGQAKQTRLRHAGEGASWRAAAAQTLDTARPYLWRSVENPETSLAVFFYRDDLDPARIYEKLPCAAAGGTPLKTSREQVVEVGRRFAGRLVDSFTANDALELSHCAVDAEIFGYRRLNGNRALTYALDYLMREAPARLTNYGEFLDLIPPPEEVRIHQASSRRGASGTAPWCRNPRAALSRLGRALDEEYLKRAGTLFYDAREALEAYGRVLLSDEPDSAQAFLDEHAARHLTPAQARAAVRSCEMSRWRLEMCSFWAWEAENFSAPRFLRALACAARALDILAILDGPAEELEKDFLEELAAYSSTEGTCRNAAQVYRKLLKPARADSRRTLAHFAVSDHLRFAPLPGAGLFDVREGGPPENDALQEQPRCVKAELRPLVRRTRKRDRRMDCLSISEVSLYDRRSHERADGLAVILHRGGTDLECWIKTGTDGAGPLAAALDDAYLKRSPDAFRESAAKACASEPYALDVLFSGSLRHASSWLAARGNARRKALFDEWLGALRRWKSAHARTAPLARLLVQTAEEAIAPDSLPLARLYRQAALEAALEFSRLPAPETLDRLTELLDAAGAAGLHLPLWEMQELAWHGARNMRIGEEDREIAQWLVRVLGISEALFLARPIEASEA